MSKNVFIRNSKGISLFAIIILIIALVLVHFYYERQKDELIANQVYHKLSIIDVELNQLQQLAQELIAQKKVNMQVIEAVKELNKENLLDNKAKLAVVVAKIDYDEEAKAEFESEIRGINTLNTKLQLRLIKKTTRELKYRYNLEINDFDKQIGEITAQTVNIKKQIMQIKGDDLRQLELAKLKFIQRKLKMTGHMLHKGFLEIILKNVIDKKAEKKSESTV